MNYAILRVQKLKTDTAVRGSLKHSFREQNTPNADPERQDDNTHIGAGDVKEAMKAYKERLPEKVRKNGVRCVEYLMTASPEKMNDMTREQQDAFFKSSLDWLKEKHGSENVVYSGVHRDETTPHMYAYVVPIDERGKLNCRKFLGGTKHVLSDLQSDYAEKVGKEHGLDRGIKGSKAKHQTVKQYYANLNKAKESKDNLTAPRMLKKGVFVNKIEKKEDVIERLADKAIELAVDKDKQRTVIERGTKTLYSLDAKLKELEPIRDLGRDDREKLIREAKLIKERKQAEQKLVREAKTRERLKNNQDKGMER